MKKKNYPNIRTQYFRGFTLIELLVGLSITSLILGAIVNAITKSSQQARDTEIITRANEVARAILDSMAFDIRLVGAGMPMGQAAFPMESYTPVTPPGIQWSSTTSATAQVDLGDAAWPILPGSDATHIYLRINERGVETVLAADYNPGAPSYTFTVLDVSDFAINDVVYISDRRENGSAGLRGQITAIDSGAKQITISSANGPNYPAGTIFGAGSSVNRVSTVSYVSVGGTTGIQMAISDYDSTLRTIHPNSSFTLTYKNRTSGTAMTMPTASSDLCEFIPPVPASGGIGSDPCGVAQSTTTVSTNKDITDLASIVITVNVTGERPLTSGGIYTATVSQEASLRNFLISY
jgi:prepilin-type N-terminal cleavage/methylation domain-containing protein